MSLAELRAKRIAIENNLEKSFTASEIIINESLRVAEVSHNAPDILDSLDYEFEKRTSLGKKEIKFLFAATSLQIIRIYLINKLTKIEKAGQGNIKEQQLKKVQNKIFKPFYNDTNQSSAKHYASLNHIISNRGVPYDAQEFLYEKLPLFKGANHRFSTMGHDPILGLIFGTANILTNTITCNKAPFLITTNHVVYNSEMKRPKIAEYTSTFLTLQMAAERLSDDKKSVVAALIKQIIHIGTDMYTPCGIQLPGLSLILSNSLVEEISKNIISTGDLIKIGVSAKIAILIDTLISIIYHLTYNKELDQYREIHQIKANKIVQYSKIIATSSSAISTALQVSAGNKFAIKDFDFAGLLLTLKKLRSDREFIRKVKYEFIFNKFDTLIRGA